MRTHFHHYGVGARQRQGKRQERKTREESEGTKRDRDTEGETSHPNRAIVTLIGHKTKEDKERNMSRALVPPSRYYLSLISANENRGDYNVKLVSKDVIRT